MENLPLDMKHVYPPHPPRVIHVYISLSHAQEIQVLSSPHKMHMYVLHAYLNILSQHPFPACVPFYIQYAVYGHKYFSSHEIGDLIAYPNLTSVDFISV